MRSRDVEIREIGTVRFMQIVIAFPEGSMGGCYNGEEERCGTEIRRDIWDGEDEMFEDCVPDSELRIY